MRKYLHIGCGDNLLPKPFINLDIRKKRGDHIWYITDFSKFKKKYKDWGLTKDISTIIREIIKSTKNI